MNSLKRINLNNVLGTFSRHAQNKDGANRLRLLTKTSLMNTQKRFLDIGMNSHNYGLPTVHLPFYELVIYGVFFYCFILSYPLYVTYKMPLWDRMEHEPGFKEKYLEEQQKKKSGQ